jgi:hypothetical protein
MKGVVSYRLLVIGLLLMLGCRQEQVQAPLFELLDSSVTGIGFANKLTPDASLNMLKYMYFYNGAGVGAGDLNNDGKIDLYFAANQEGDRLYLNKGGFKFEDVTRAAGVPMDKGWSTGVSIVDINNDGMLDIYVCRVGNYASLKNHNLLLVCQTIGKDGIPVYKDESQQRGLAFSGFSTQAAFLDYDKDGDLDMYLLNHSLRYNSTFRPRDQFMNSYDSLSGDRLYQNSGGMFTDITRQSGINSSNIGYGLGICVTDINHDGWPDIYVSNDFHENDYLYINQKNGRFIDELNDRIDHTSQFSMGVDIADINNDLQPEIITLDMLPEDPYILKRSLGDDEYNLYLMKLKYGYNHQFTRNNLQLNRGDGYFSEIGFYANVAATDWSWSALWVDFNNDGNKDLFISNGIPKRLNDIDYVNYISNESIQEKIRKDQMRKEDFAFIDQFPEIKLPNKFLVNGSALRFEDEGLRVKGDRPSFSNGAAYADLDNDGDLDLIVNNIQDAAFIYQNQSSGNRSVTVVPVGEPGNRNALGTRILAYKRDTVQLYEKQAVRGFQSSMEVPLVIGMGTSDADSLLVVWPDQTYERWIPSGAVSWKPVWRKGLPAFQGGRWRTEGGRLKVEGGRAFHDDAAQLGLLYTHKENDYVEFNREPLLPHMLSTEGPALAVGDLNNDGMDDVFVGGARGKKAGLFVQRADGVFVPWQSEVLNADSLYEDVDAIWNDVNGDGWKDLVVVSGGNEYYGADSLKWPRVYLNQEGKSFTKTNIKGVASTLSCVVPMDVNNDGKTDLFFGGRAITFAYGTVPSSYLMQNDGRGGFRDVTAGSAPGLAQIGFVKGATATDLNGDKDQDIVLALEWGGVVAFIKDGAVFRQQTLLPTKGWWSFVKAADLDGDGDVDLVVGNQGENSRVRPTLQEPVRMYYDDFDGNGLKEQFITYYLRGEEIPFANKSELDKQMPGLKKRFLYAEQFAKSAVDKIIDRALLNKAPVFTAETFSNAMLINEGGLRFRLQPMPAMAQLSNYNDALITDLNKDGKPDVVLAGNFDADVIALGRNDTDHGSLLINGGSGNFSYQQMNGLSVRGVSKKIREITVSGKRYLLIARNNETLLAISY